MYCSTMFVKKWALLTLVEALYLLDRPYENLLEDLAGEDMKPRPWNENEAMGLEMRQRLGVDPVSDKRQHLLESGFIFPKVLDVLLKKYPNGLPVGPMNIIWPVDRDLEIDLNYSKNAKFVIKDPNKETTLKKRKWKAELDEIRRKAAAEAEW
jgi:hypothetical protein